MEQCHLTDQFLLLGRCIVGLALIAAGASKLVAYSGFEETVEAYDLLPKGPSRVLARILPPAEFVIGTLLWLGLVSPWTEIGAAVLLVVFASALSVNLLRGRVDISCGCFGIQTNEHISWGQVLRNMIFLGIVVVPLVGDSAVRQGNTFVDAMPTRLMSLGIGAIWWLYVSLKAFWTISTEPKV